ncbi:DUF58 domain-containing protein [Vibrio breoganii]|uniref:MoxR protein n=1 Tax=Vibrio breoganii TaxID=553239 RepID=A0AAP8MVK1_9VIBR|nr:DUF58 domain-containing protein [Vibrio breoganii]PMF83587.1 MoxR protein [Vibrio breoganii]PMG90725.1 MoxR protein [Vibrio breoganii]PML40968.1 MoxR protein [Vibrio breoganii]PML98146.1 MoxR protein [Vibrio breoganii]PMN64601.1 MoxR protein [Vibrio breoganii]
MKSAQRETGDARIYCQYARLVQLQGQVGSFSFLPQLKAGTILSGRHQSLFRGRGLNFEELRHYQNGDDIRNLDWKVTMRTGKPHVRAYTEEKDRNVILCVDQRSSLFFSSIEVMKSVVAAEIAALSAWRVLKDSDRVGFIIARPDGVDWYKPQRSRSHLLHRLHCLAEANQSLNVSSQDSESASFGQLMSVITRVATKGSTVIVLSDWHGAKESDVDRLQQLQAHNDVLTVLISDRLEEELPSRSNWVMGDGTHQLNISESAKLKQANLGLKQHQELKKSQLVRLMAAKGLPLIHLDTSGNHLEQFKRGMGVHR